MKVKDLAADFLRGHERASKPATVKFYRHGLKWVVSAFGDLDWEQLDRREVLGAMDQANRRPDGTKWKANTIIRNITAFEQLQLFALEDDEKAKPVLRPRDLKKPTGSQREAIPTADELLTLFEKATPAAAVAFKALAASGMRPAELVAAQIADLNAARDLLTLEDHKTRTTSGKAKAIPLGKTLKDLVAVATGERTAGAIFLDEDGHPWTVDRLSYRFRAIKKRHGLNPALVLYSLRHHKGTMVATKKGLLAAKEILNHSTVKTTERYCHPTIEQRRKWMEDAED